MIPLKSPAPAKCPHGRARRISARGSDRPSHEKPAARAGQACPPSHCDAGEVGPGARSWWRGRAKREGVSHCPSIQKHVGDRPGSASRWVWPRDPRSVARCLGCGPTSPCGPSARRHSPEGPPRIRASRLQRSLSTSWLGSWGRPHAQGCCGRWAPGATSQDGICPWTSARHSTPRPGRCPRKGAVRGGPSLGTAGGSDVSTAGLARPPPAAPTRPERCNPQVPSEMRLEPPPRGPSSPDRSTLGLRQPHPPCTLRSPNPACRDRGSLPTPLQPQEAEPAPAPPPGRLFPPWLHPPSPTLPQDH